MVVEVEAAAQIRDSSAVIVASNIPALFLNKVSGILHGWRIHHCTLPSDNCVHVIGRGRLLRTSEGVQSRSQGCLAECADLRDSLLKAKNGRRSPWRAYVSSE